MEFKKIQILILKGVKINFNNIFNRVHPDAANINMLLKIIGATPDAATHSSAVGCLIKPATKWRV